MSVLMFALVCAAFAICIRSVLKGKTKPPFTAWAIWSVVDGITGAAMLTKGTLNAQMAAVVLGAWATTGVLFFKKNKGALLARDKFALAGACVGMALWGILRDPVAGLVVSLTVTLTGGALVGIGSWRSPDADDRAARTIWALASSLALACAWSEGPWTFANLAEPVAFTAMDVGLAAVIWWRWPLRQAV